MPRHGLSNPNRRDASDMIMPSTPTIRLMVAGASGWPSWFSTEDLPFRWLTSALRNCRTSARWISPMCRWPKRGSRCVSRMDSTAPRYDTRHSICFSCFQVCTKSANEGSSAWRVTAFGTIMPGASIPVGRAKRLALLLPGKTRSYTNLRAAMSLSMTVSTLSIFRRFAGVSCSCDNSRQRSPSKRKSKKSLPSLRARTLDMAHAACSHGDGMRFRLGGPRAGFGPVVPLLHSCRGTRSAQTDAAPLVGTDISFNGLPQEQDLPAAERADVVDALQKDRILQPVANRACVILDEFRQFLGRQVGAGAGGF